MPVLLLFCIEVAGSYYSPLFAIHIQDSQNCWYGHINDFSVNELLKTRTSTALKLP